MSLVSLVIDASASCFTFEDENGVTHTIPLHRVRVVYKDGKEIWRRRGPTLGTDHGSR